MGTAAQRLAKLDTEVAALAAEVKDAKNAWLSATDTQREAKLKEVYNDLKEKEKQVLPQLLDARRALEAKLPGADVNTMERIAKGVYHEQFAKESTSTITTARDIGADVLERATQDQGHFEAILADYNLERAKLFLESAPGLSVKTSWAAASREDDLQQCANIMVPALLGGNPTLAAHFWDTHARGLSGRGLKIDLTITEGSQQCSGHAATFGELKFDLRAQQSEGVGQLADRVAAMSPDQEQRDVWVAAIIGKQHIQLWSLYNDGKAICSRLESLSLDTGSAGFQLLARWLATPFSELGYIAPALPGAIKLENTTMAVEARLLQNASHADAAGKKRPGVVVFSGTLAHDGSKAVAKVPRSNLIRLEVQNLELVSSWKDVAPHAVRLVGVSNLVLGGEQRPALVLQPLAELVPFDISPDALLLYAQQLVDIIAALERHGYIHGDLSYYNLLILKGQPLLSDLQTLMKLTEASSAGGQTGTPLFMSIAVMIGMGHSMGTELESLMYVIIFILSGGRLPWAKAHRDPAFFRQGTMTLCFSSRVLTRIPEQCHAWVSRLQALFFSGVYVKPSVTCQAFRAACFL